MLIAAPVSETSAEELSSAEKRSTVNDLLAQGDQYFEAKNYNLANATYESIFLLDPTNVKASGRIDRLKKQLLKEGKSETQLVTRIYDGEIELRVDQYLKQAKSFIQAGNWAQARFVLQKILLLNPLHEESQKLYNQVNRKLAGQAS